MVDYLADELDSDPGPPAHDEADPPLPHLLAALDAFQRRLASEMEGRMRPHGARLRGSYGRILGLLPPEGARPSVLAEGWISKQAVGKRIQEMAAVGLVSVEPDPIDRRATIVRRTPEGDRLRAVANEAINELEATLANEVGSERYQIFRAVLDELAAPR